MNVSPIRSAPNTPTPCPAAPWRRTTLSSAVSQALGSAISKAPKRLSAKPTKIAERSRFTQGLRGEHRDTGGSHEDGEREPQRGETRDDAESEDERVADRRAAIGGRVAREVRDGDRHHWEDARREQRQRAGGCREPDEAEGHARPTFTGASTVSVCGGRQSVALQVWKRALIGERVGAGPRARGGAHHERKRRLARRRSRR